MFKWRTLDHQKQTLKIGEIRKLLGMEWNSIRNPEVLRQIDSDELLECLELLAWTDRELFEEDSMYSYSTGDWKNEAVCNVLRTEILRRMNENAAP